MNFVDCELYDNRGDGKSIARGNIINLDSFLGDNIFWITLDTGYSIRIDRRKIVEKLMLEKLDGQKSN